MGFLTQAASHLKGLWAAIEVKALVVLFGATWAFYKLIQRGGLHPLLDLKVSGRLIRIAIPGVSAVFHGSAERPFTYGSHRILRAETLIDVQGR